MNRNLLYLTIGLGIVIAGLLGVWLDRFVPDDYQSTFSESIGVGLNDSDSATEEGLHSKVQTSVLDVSSVDFDSNKSPGDGSEYSDDAVTAENSDSVISEASSINRDSLNSESEYTQPILSERARRVIEEVQTRQLAGQWEEALNEMNALYTEFQDLNSFEQSTLLNFYTNTLIRMQMWEEAVSAFTLMLTIEDLRPTHHARALLAIGQLHSRLGAVDEATSHYNAWLDFTEGLDEFAEQRERVLEQLSQIGN